MVGILQSIYIAASSGGELEARPEALLVSGAGIVGDRYYHKGHASPEEELTLVAAEEIDGFNERSGLNISYAAVRRNLVTVGVALNSLVGVRFKIGSAEVEGIELCEPCVVVGRLLACGEIQPKDVVRELRHRGGLRARIVTGGTVRVGDEIRAMPGC